MKTISFVCETFAAGETADVTGVSVMQQRNLRRLGHDDKSTSSHERRDLLSLAKLRVLKLLGDFGLPPGAIKDIAASAAVIVSAWAAREPAALHDPEGLAKGERPVRGDPSGQRFLIWDGQTAEFTASAAEFDSIFAGLKSRKSIAAAIVIDLRAVAEDMVRRSPKPFWRVVMMED